MTEQLKITISGMRGIFGRGLTEAVVTEYAKSFGSFLRDRAQEPEKLSVCIGRDSRTSGETLKTAVADGLCSMGIDVIDLGIVSTPGVGIMLSQLCCCGGVVITASHNPSEYNGIKLLLDNSMAPPTDEAEQIKKLYFDKSYVEVDSASRGSVTSSDRTDAVHIEKVLGLIDARAIAKNGYSVVLDSVNGAGGRVGLKLLDALGCKTVSMNNEPTGIFAHIPEPTAENLTDLCEVVKTEDAQIGFAQDPDADRLAIVDENGTYIGEEYTLALASKYVLTKMTGPVATNLSTSRMIDDIAAEAGVDVIRTPVGEVNVAAAMIENSCVIGGEGNGGVIDLRVCPIRDSLVAMALVLQLMAETQKTISQLVDEIGGYFMCKDKFEADQSQAQQILKAARKTFNDAKVDVRDGYRFDFSDGWVHIRTSNTEPVMRVIIEAKDKVTANKYSEMIMKIRKDVFG
jgi:phosphomannomutase